MTPPSNDNNNAAKTDPDLAASCRAAVAAAENERNPLAILAAALLLAFLLLSGGTLAWLRFRVVPAVAAPVTLTTVLGSGTLIPKAATTPAPAPPNGNPGR